MLSMPHRISPGHLEKSNRYFKIEDKAHTPLTFKGFGFGFGEEKNYEFMQIELKGSDKDSFVSSVNLMV